MGECLLVRHGGGNDTAAVTAEAKDVLKDKVIVDANGEKITGTLEPKPANLIRNGNLSKSDCWNFVHGQYGSDGELLTGCPAFIDSFPETDIGTPLVIAYQSIYELLVNNIYYFSFWVYTFSGWKVGSTSSRGVASLWRNDGVTDSGALSGSPVKTLVTIKESTIEESGKWVMLSCSFTVGTGYSPLKLVLTQDSDGIYMTGFSFVNLTKTFGAGNEPDKETMDKFIKRDIVFNDNMEDYVFDGDAQSSDVLANKTAYGKYGIIHGSMTNNGAVTKSLSAGESYTIPKGYHNGNGTVAAATLSSQTSGTAVAANILSNKTAWVNGTKVTGSMLDKSSSTNILGTASLDTTNKYLKLSIPLNGYYSGNSFLYSTYSTIASIIGLSASKIVSGNTILGISGTGGTRTLTFSGTSSLTNATSINVDVNSSSGSTTTSFYYRKNTSYSPNAWKCKTTYTAVNSSYVYGSTITTHSNGLVEIAVAHGYSGSTTPTYSGNVTTYISSLVSTNPVIMYVMTNYSYTLNYEITLYN